MSESTKIAIHNIGGYPNLKSVILPIVVNAEYFYDGCYTVFAEEFRGYCNNERMPDANNGKGLSHSFYHEGSYKVLLDNKDKL